jgi:hypothetical protein
MTPTSALLSRLQPGHESEHLKVKVFFHPLAHGSLILFTALLNGLTYPTAWFLLLATGDRRKTMV